MLLFPQVANRRALLHDQALRQSVRALFDQTNALDTDSARRCVWIHKRAFDHQVKALGDSGMCRLAIS